MMANGLPKKVQDKLDDARERAQDQKWTEQQERLLRAAQAVVNDASPDLDEEDGQMIVDQEVFADLKAIVQEISDDVVKVIEASQPIAFAVQDARQREVLGGCTCGEAYGTRISGGLLCAYCMKG